MQTFFTFLQGLVEEEEEKEEESSACAGSWSCSELTERFQLALQVLVYLSTIDHFNTQEVRSNRFFNLLKKTNLLMSVKPERTHTSTLSFLDLHVIKFKGQTS